MKDFVAIGQANLARGNHIRCVAAELGVIVQHYILHIVRGRRCNGLRDLECIESKTVASPGL